MNKLMLLLKGQMALLFGSKRVDKKVWIFSSRNNTDFNYNSKYLFLYVLEHCKDIKPRYVINDEVKRKELQKLYGEEYFIETLSWKGMQQVLHAGVWFTSAGLPVYALGTGKKHTIVNLWHGVPLKKISLCEEGLSTLVRLYFRKVFSENYAYILTSSEKLVPIMAKSFAVSEEMIKIWGQPRNDVLLDTALQTEKISDFAEVPAYEKVILYAPTYRDTGTTRWFPFEDFDIDRLQHYLEKEHILLCLRAHAEEHVPEELCKCANIINLDSKIIDDISGRLYLFDMLITDYSSIFIDFMLLNRPMIFLPYDKDEYLDERGMNFSYDEVTLGKKPCMFEEFLEAIETEFTQDTYREERMRVNEVFNQVKNPCSSRICDEIYKETR